MATRDKDGEQIGGEQAGSGDSAASFFATMARAMNPATMFEQGLEMTRTMFDIATGQSNIAPDARDWRFQDKAWTANPYYRRLAQAYLAMSEAVEQMIPDELSMENKARADLAASIVTSAMSPTNTLLGNPAALARTVETGGSNLVRGFSAFLDDLRHNGGLPSQVDDSQFEVGRNMAVTPGKIVLRTEMFELIEYAPVTAKVRAVPALLVPPQIGRYYFTDLAPGRSFAEYVVSQGLHYFAVSWRNPGPEHREWSLDDYTAAAIEAIEAVSAISGAPKVNLIGFCAGGITSAIAAAVLAARGRDLINTLTLCVTMLDFKTDAALGAFRFPTVLSVAKAQSEMKGVLPGTELHKIFTWLRPNDLVWNYWVNNYLMGDSPPAFDILAWNKDSTNMPARLHKDFLDLFEANALIRPGAHTALGKAVDLSRLKMDTFVVGAVTDHLTPWKCCYEAQKLLGGDKTFALSNGGHVAALVNPPGNPKAFHFMAEADAPDGESWLGSAPKNPGSWWEGWTKWAASRSGKQVEAPKSAGSKRFPALADAPGTYVRQ